MAKVIVLGSINFDISSNIPHFPDIGETVKGANFTTCLGGKGANQAVAAKRLGSEVVLIGKVGNDSFGENLLRNIQKENLSLKHIQIDELIPTGVAFIAVDKHGSNKIYVSGGANDALTPDDLANIEIDKSDIVISTLESPQPAIKELFKIAKNKKAKTILNYAPAIECDLELLKLADVLVLNETEISFLSKNKIDPTNLNTVVDAAKANQFQKSQAIVITLGGNGVFMLDKEKELFFPAFSVKAIDTTAAGDCFIGAFATGILNGLKEDDLLRWSNAASAISVQRFGATQSLPIREELVEFLAKDK